MKEVSKEEFKEVYFKYGRAEDGWGADYWDKFYEPLEDITYYIQLPANEKERRMMIVENFSEKEIRLFFLSIDKEEGLFRQGAV